jgi:hypothetical protein
VVRRREACGRRSGPGENGPELPVEQRRAGRGVGGLREIQRSHLETFRAHHPAGARPAPRRGWW